MQPGQVPPSIAPAAAVVDPNLVAQPPIEQAMVAEKVKDDQIAKEKAMKE